MRAVLLLFVPAFTAAAFVLMVADARGGGDWPGWDEGWALVAFPLGIPLAIRIGLATASAPQLGRSTLAATLAVWAWGAAVFVLWHALG